MNAGWRFSLLVAVMAHVSGSWVQALRRGLAARQRLPAPLRPAPTVWPRVSVLVPAWCERGTIELCLQALGRVAYPDWSIIVLAGGPDGTYGAAVAAANSLPNAHVVVQGPGGKNAALNQGLAYADGAVIVLLDADSQVTPGWLHELVAALDAATPVVTGTYLPRRRTAISLEEQMELIALREIRGQVILQGSGSIALRRSVLEQIGGFPEHVRVGVDWDLDARLAWRGIGRGLAGRAVLLTERPASLAEFWRNELRWRRAHLRSLLRLRSYVMPTPQAILRQLYIYGLAWGVIGGSLALPALLVALPPERRRSVIHAWGLGLVWVLLRRAALAIEVAAYRRSWVWLRFIWAPPALLCLTLAASVVATLDLLRAEHTTFKGPRHAQSFTNAH